jgi:hypothetical protein
MNLSVVMTCMLTDPPRESMVRGSAAQTVDGKLRVRAPGFRSSAFPQLMQPRGLRLLDDPTNYM